jgi:hypothetical protein
LFCSDDCRSWPLEEKCWSDDCRSWPREERINNHGCWGKHAHIPDNDYWGICLFHVVWTNLFFAIILMWYTRNIYIFLFTNWTLRMSDNFPERVQILGHAHIICITVRDNIIICYQIFCDLLLKSAFERIFNVMQLILVKIKWHMKWKYLIKTFHDIGLSYYFKTLHNEKKSEVIVYNWLVCHSWKVVLLPKNTSATVLQRQPPFSNYSFYNIYTTWHGYCRKPFFC